MSLYGSLSDIEISGIVSDASNIRVGDNPVYTVDDFYILYPQFGQKTDGTYVVATEILNMYIALANSCIKETRWHSYWKFAMGLFIAHFCTLWLQSTADPDSNAAQVVSKGQSLGLMASKAVDGVSVQYDFSSVANDLNGWAAWKLTIYGQQLATFGKLVGKGNMYVY